MNDETPGSVQRDFEKFQEMRENGGFDRTFPALLEFALSTTTAVLSLSWIVVLFLWVPDPVPGEIWLGFGMFTIALFSSVTLLVWIIRRKGLTIVRALVRGGI